MDLLLFPACVLYLLYAYFTTARAMRGNGSSGTTGAGAGAEQQEQAQQESRQLFVQGGGKHARIRRRLVGVGLATAAAWVLGFLADTVVWARALHGRTAPLQAYPARLITCRLIGIVDALVLAGAVDALGACLTALCCCRQRQRQRQRQQQLQQRSPLSLLVGAFAGRGQDGDGGVVMVGMDQEMALVKKKQEQLRQGSGGGDSSSSNPSLVPTFFGGNNLSLIHI